VPVARLIDMKAYRTAGSPRVTVGSAIGIAEVSNANFFSEDTSANSPFTRNYPFPSVDTLEASTLAAPLGGRVRAYLKKRVDPATGWAADGGLPVNPVLSQCIFYQAAAGDGVVQPIARNCVDENVWNAVAQQMLPRAVGYSAAVLDYFFRGRLEIQMDHLVDAQSRPLRDENGDVRFGMRLVNRTPGETMSGNFEVRYDTASGSRERLTSWSLTLDPDVPTDLLPLPSPSSRVPVEPKR